MSYSDGLHHEKGVPATDQRQATTADDVFGAEEGHQIQYKTLSWQVCYLAGFVSAYNHPYMRSLSPC
jgi:hypothetical protein